MKTSNTHTNYRLKWNSRGIAEIWQRSPKRFICSTGQTEESSAWNYFFAWQNNGGGLTLEDAVNNYLTYLRLAEKPESTLRKTRNFINASIYPAFEKSSPVRNITQDQVRAWSAKRQEAGLSKSSRIRERTVLNAVLNLAIRDGHLDKNPCRGLRLGKDQKKRLRVFTQEEFQRMHEASHPFLKRWLVFMLNTGCRPSESFNLQWERLHEGQWPYIVIGPGRDRITGQPFRTKNGVTRSIRLNASALQAIQEQRQWLQKQPWGKDCQWVWPGQSGRRRTAIQALWNKARTAAGLDARPGEESLVPYSLRHTFGTNMADGGISTPKLAAAIGASMAMAERYVTREKLDIGPSIEKLPNWTPNGPPALSNSAQNIPEETPQKIRRKASK